MSPFLMYFSGFCVIFMDFVCQIIGTSMSVKGDVAIVMVVRFL